MVNALPAGYGATLHRHASYRHLEIWNEVPLVPQLTGMSCWAAAAAMIVGWRDRVPVNPEEVSRAVGRWRAYRDGLHPADVPALAAAWKLTVESPRVWTVDALATLLHRYGPLWMGEASPGLHSIVVAGLHGDGSPDGTYLRINDPWPVGRGERYVRGYSELMRSFQVATDAVGPHAQLLHSGGRGSGPSRQYELRQERTISVITPDEQEANMGTTATSRSIHAAGYLRGLEVLGSGEQYLRSSIFTVDPLATHGGAGDNLYLTWNAIPEDIEAIDVVVHLHGYSARPADAPMLSGKARISGLDLSRRLRPTLALLPRGKKVSAAEIEAERVNGHNPNPDRYTFPGLCSGNGQGLEQLLAHVLAWFGTTHLGLPAGEGLSVDRLIFTAHSGGGAAVNKLLRWSGDRRVCNPDEVHLFDAIYGAPGQQGDGFVAWATARIVSDRDAGSDLVTARGALRILFRVNSGTAPGSLWIGNQLMGADLLGGRAAALRPLYRVEGVSTAHDEIPRQFGAALLENPAADLAGATAIAHAYGTPVGVFAHYTEPRVRDSVLAYPRTSRRASPSPRLRSHGLDLPLPEQVVYETERGHDFGPHWRNNQPPGLPSYARLASRQGAAYPLVEEFARATGLGEDFVMVIRHLAQTESNGTFALPANTFDNRPAAERGGAALITAWGLFQFNRDAWRSLPEVGATDFPWDSTAYEELVRPIHRYAAIYEEVVAAGGDARDALRGLRLYHGAPTVYRRDYLAIGRDRGFTEAWASLPERWRNWVDMHLRRAGPSFAQALL